MKTYSLKLDVQQLSVIDSALAEIPFKLAAPLIRSINEQIKSQDTSYSENLDENGVEMP